MNASAPSAEYLAESRATELNVFYSIPIPLEILTTAWRIYVRVATSPRSGLRWDDHLMSFATAMAVGVCISGLVYGAPFGLGRHIEAVSERDFQTFMKGNYIFSHFYNLAIASTKLSVLALYHRIFATRTYRLLVLATACFVVLWLLTIEVVLGFACRPVQAFWGAAPGTCLNLVAFGYFTNVTNLVADLWIFALPIPMLLGLQAKLSKKVGLCFLFSVGLGTCAISAARLTWVFSFGSTDITWTQVSLGILSAWEPCGGILGGNLPIVYKTIKGIFPSRGSTPSPSEQKTGSTQESLGPKKETVYSDWARLDSSGSTAVAMETVRSSHEGHSGAVLPKRSAASMELELFEDFPAPTSPHAL